MLNDSDINSFVESKGLGENYITLDNRGSNSISAQNSDVDSPRITVKTQQHTPYLNKRSFDPSEVHEIVPVNDENGGFESFEEHKKVYSLFFTFV
jgi:hypothetical protein